MKRFILGATVIGATVIGLALVNTNLYAVKKAATVVIEMWGEGKGMESSKENSPQLLVVGSVDCTMMSFLQN